MNLGALVLGAYLFRIAVSLVELIPLSLYNDFLYFFFLLLIWKSVLSNIGIDTPAWFWFSVVLHIFYTFLPWVYKNLYELSGSLEANIYFAFLKSILTIYFFNEGHLGHLPSKLVFMCWGTVTVIKLVVVYLLCWLHCFISPVSFIFSSVLYWCIYP